MSDIVQKLRGVRHALRPDGVDYGDYIEQITYLLFFKMVDERGRKLNSLTYKDSRGREVKCDCS
jgi:type I restriction enzyme M protein